MARRTTSLRWAGAALAAALVLACAALSVWLDDTSAARRLASARQQWRASAPARYRLVAEAGAGCVLDVAVSGGRVTTVYRRDSCSPAAHTVDELFDLIDSIRLVSYTCIAFECACRSTMGTRTEFDPALGYPHSIALWSRREPNLWQPAYWRYTLTHQAPPPSCQRSSEAVMVRVVSLTALP